MRGTSRIAAVRLHGARDQRQVLSKNLFSFEVFVRRSFLFRPISNAHGSLFSQRIIFRIHESTDHQICAQRTFGAQCNGAGSNKGTFTVENFPSSKWNELNEFLVASGSLNLFDIFHCPFSLLRLSYFQMQSICFCNFY